jgi:hypothetical protein
MTAMKRDIRRQAILDYAARQFKIGRDENGITDENCHILGERFWIAVRYWALMNGNREMARQAYENAAAHYHNIPNW